MLISVCVFFLNYSLKFNILLNYKGLQKFQDFVSGDFIKTHKHPFETKFILTFRK